MISIFYTFNKDKDQTFNFCSYTGNTDKLDDFKIKHVITSLPLNLNRPYHFRFKTICEDAEPKINAWIDISNPNAKAPLINNCVYVKILELDKFGLSKIYTQAKMQSIKTLQPIVNNSAPLNKPNNPIQKTTSVQQIIKSPPIIQQQAQPQVTPKQSQTTSGGFFSNFMKSPEPQQPSKPIETPPRIQSSITSTTPTQFYQQQQKALDNLLGEDYEDEFSSYQQTPAQKQPQTNILDSFTPVQNTSPQIRHQSQQPTSNSVNLMGFEEEYTIPQQQSFQPQQQQSQIIQTFQQQAPSLVEETLDREQIKANNQRKVDEYVQGKVDELKKMWNDEEQYTIWRQDAKDQLEPQIQRWAFTNGSRNQIRNMLCMLHEILWPESGWTQCSIADLLTDGAVKRKYHDAIRVVHPDKNQDRDYRQRFISERVFFELNQSFNLHRKTK